MKTYSQPYSYLNPKLEYDQGMNTTNPPRVMTLDQFHLCGCSLHSPHPPSDPSTPSHPALFSLTSFPFCSCSRPGPPPMVHHKSSLCIVHHKSLKLLTDLRRPRPSREYSISSGPSPHPNRIEITAAMVRYTSSTTMERFGVCTSFLALQGSKGGKVPIWTRPGSLRIPLKLQGPPPPPLVMVGPGTGLAPLRCFIQVLLAKDSFAIVFQWGRVPPRSMRTFFRSKADGS
jgi:hypothetical protein